MADITITVSDDLNGWLQAQTADYNNRTSSALTVAEWVVFSFRERAILEDMQAETERLQRQYDRDLQAAIRAKKTELMGNL